MSTIIMQSSEQLMLPSDSVYHYVLQKSCTNGDDRGLNKPFLGLDSLHLYLKNTPPDRVPFPDMETTRCPFGREQRNTLSRVVSRSAAHSSPSTIDSRSVSISSGKRSWYRGVKASCRKNSIKSETSPLSKAASRFCDLGSTRRIVVRDASVRIVSR